jgi:hypothetical protein
LSSTADISYGNHGAKSTEVAVETKGGFYPQPDGILKAFIYAQTIDEIEGQIKRRKKDGMRAENLGV